MKIDISINNHGFKRSGGLLLGIKIDYPVSIYDMEAFANNHTYTSVRITIGLILISVTLHVNYNYKKTQMI